MRRSRLCLSTQGPVVLQAPYAPLILLIKEHDFDLLQLPLLVCHSLDCVRIRGFCLVREALGGIATGAQVFKWVTAYQD